MKLVIRSSLPLLNAGKDTGGNPAEWPIMGTIAFDGDRVVTTGSGDQFVGMRAFDGHRWLTTRDGDAWLYAMEGEFRSGYDHVEVVESEAEWRRRGTRQDQR